MKLIKVQDLKYADFIAKAQVNMAQETEDYKLSYETVLKGVSSAIQDPKKGIYYIAEVENKPIACLFTVLEWSDWRAKNVMWIHSVYVSKDFRAQGIYKFMYQQLQNKIQNSDEFAGIRLYVDKRNTNALEVYHKLGMESEHYSLCEWLK